MPVCFRSLVSASYVSCSQPSKSATSISTVARHVCTYRWHPNVHACLVVSMTMIISFYWVIWSVQEEVAWLVSNGRKNVWWRLVDNLMAVLLARYIQHGWHSPLPQTHPWSSSVVHLFMLLSWNAGFDIIVSDLLWLTAIPCSPRTSSAPVV